MIFCSGACSHIDTWDYKPELIKRHDTPMPGSDKLITFQGKSGNLIKSPWEFKPRGESGKYVSDLLPELAGLADRMCFIHSMTSKINTHGPGENFMSTGFTVEGYPIAGAWVSYALGSECDNLPAFVAIPDPRGTPQAGPSNWSSGFLPAVFQGTAFNAAEPIANLASPSEIRAATSADARLSQAAQRRAPRSATRATASWPRASPATSWPPNYSSSAPEAGDLSRETAATHASYGTGDANANKAGFAPTACWRVGCSSAACGSCSCSTAPTRWAKASAIGTATRRSKPSTTSTAPILDQPAAALLKDIETRGLLDDTLVVWTTEFGRMPTFQAGANGRDHNPKGFTVWLAGAGVKRGFSYGATDEFGYQAVEKPTSVYELLRDDLAPARPRSPPAQLLPQRHRTAPHLRPRPRDRRHPGIAGGGRCAASPADEAFSSPR